MIEDLQTRILSEKNQRWQGETVEVLVENQAKGKWRGRTRHGKLVFFDQAQDCRGHLVPVRIDWAGPFTMLGRPAREAMRAVPVAAAAP